MARIGVEATLNAVKEHLQQNGHEVVNLEAKDAAQCDCCVISGQDKDVMGIANVTTKGSVINAQGMTTEEVAQAVNQSIGQ
ncbi:MAG TPA: YkuS family protein [Bacillota bacterium]|nr:YkuS family protein [Bacillota bacterium]